MTRDFAFTVQGKPGAAYSIGTTHVCLTLPIAGCKAVVTTHQLAEYHGDKGTIQ